MHVKQQSIKFAIVGIATAFFYYILLYSLVEHFSIPTTLSSSLAYILVIIFNYLMHYRWTFHSESHHKIAVFRFIIMNIGGFIINVLIMSYGAYIIAAHYLVIQTIAIATIVTWNYTISSLWVYRKKHTNKVT